jgi:riboflavin kinase/FMN adenylyltransferase
MRFRSRLERLRGGSAVAIGNFDGFHAGHRRIIESLQAAARLRGLASVVLTFHPHPRVFFGHAIQLISTDRQRLELLRRQELDRLYFIDFASVVSCPASEFIRDVLLGALRLEVLVVGDDFRFGRGREGDLAFLREQAAGRFAVLRAPSVEIDGARVTSSRIRKLLAAGRIREANRLLERPYFIDGTVAKGAGRGRALGFPTMNIASGNDILPGGVFHTELEFSGPPVPMDRGVGAFEATPDARTGKGGRRYPSATFIGRAPAFTDPQQPRRVETHVPGFRRMVYGRKVRLHFLDKIREERTFPGAAELVEQIRRDIASLGI